MIRSRKRVRAPEASGRPDAAPSPVSERRKLRVLCWLIRLANEELDAAIYAHPPPADRDERLLAGARLRDAVDADLERFGGASDEDWRAFWTDFETPGFDPTSPEAEASSASGRPDAG